MSHHEYNRIRSSLTPFIRLMLAIALLGLLASCGGGGGSGNDYVSPDNLPQLQRISSSQLINTDEGYVAQGYLEIYPKSRDIHSDVQKFFKANNWTVTGYLMAANLYHVDTGEKTYAGMKNAKDKAINSGLFDGNVYYVQLAQPNYTPNDYAFIYPASSWNFDAASIRAAWDLLINSKINLTPVTLAVLDQGFTTYDAVADLPITAMYNSDTSYVCDNFFREIWKVSEIACQDHGYHVAGIIGAKSNNNIGTAGIASGLNDIILNTAGGRDPTLLANGAANLIWNFPRAMNFSLGNPNIPSGGTGTLTNEQISKINAFATSNKNTKFYKNLYEFNIQNEKSTDILIVQASGNGGGYKYNGISIPSELNGFFSGLDESDTWTNENLHDKSIIVGSYDGNKTVSYFTQLPNTEYGKSNFILAPGEGIYSTTRDGLGVLSGTSQAAPHVTGVAGLIFQINPKLSAKKVRNIILDNSDSITHSNGITYKALNAEKSVRAALATLTPPAATISIITPTPTAGSGVVFQPNITASPNGGVTEYEWDFGDNTIQRGTAGQISHTYSSGGSYTVKLKIKDAKGVTNTTTVPVTVTPVPTQSLQAFISSLETTPVNLAGIAVSGSDIYVANLTKDLSQFRSNYDNTPFYKSSILVTKIADKDIKWQKTIATDYYIANETGNLWQTNIGFSADGTKLLVAASSYTGSGYSMSGGKFTINIASPDTQSYTSLYTSDNLGWFPYFSSGQLNHFSYGGYYGCIENSCNRSIDPNAFATESHNKILQAIGLTGNLTSPMSGLRATMISRLKQLVGV